MNLALFDFDGTITTRGTYLDFIRFAVSRRRQVIGSAALSPCMAAYRLGLVRERSLRPLVARVAFGGTPATTLRERGERFANIAIPPLVRDEAKRRIDWHKQQGDTIVVVSASLDVYLESWCRTHSLALICTQLEVRNGRATGRYVDGDCTGAEKKRRVLQRYEPERYDLVYAYGDTAEDDEMLSLAHRKFFRWQEVNP
ncbi:MAG TPA: HAD family hydrolase [Polyangiaceae bacterium]|nr:HAD family hydrolase [Polyangiaceae bacterium]